MQIVYHPDGSMSKLSTPELKKVEIDYHNWYCPIHEYVWMVRWDGTIKSGTCGQNVLFHKNKPFWEGKGGMQTNSFCKFAKGSCNCGSDLNSPKAINKEIYDKFVRESDKIVQSDLPLYDGKEIIATAAKFKLNSLCEIHLDIGKMCNFDCSYCPSHVHDSVSPFMDLKKTNRALQIIESKIPKNKNKFIIITGGEPTLYKDLDKLIVLLRAKNSTQISINSNGTASYKRYEQLLENDIKFDITFHYEFTNEKIIKKCVKLKEKYPNTVKLKMLTRDDKFKSLVKQHTNEFIEYPIYDKFSVKQVLL